MAKQRKNLLAKSIKTDNTEPKLAPKPELQQKVDIKKTRLIEDEQIEKATKKIHSKKHEQKSVRFTMDIPEDIYFEIKMSMIKRKMKTMKEYFLMLAAQDRQ